MNFLAHFHFSYGDDDLLHGQFIADEVKGKAHEQYPQRIQYGILLHRYIDHFTDTHELCKALRAKLRLELGLLTPIAIDVFFDHVLASNFEQYTGLRLESFVEDVYEKLSARRESFSPKMKFLLDKMKQNNWLVMYKSISGTSTLLLQMSARLSYGKPLQQAPLILTRHYNELMETFNLFYPEIKNGTFSKLDTFAHLHP
ncbi:MAG: ACP phosphodiesterase [Flavobacteriales bacterium]